ncbi:hypothetical protein OG345_42280 (plasmid) [Streptomyces sp. NBC_01220]|uniref:hypothetical protein n=1 Tax=Streptomyces sp. NBC_01220 TaxID=2903781 RepID=UPI00352C9472|nr:hypothetical protein OG345_42280 [Streptomyces sp. NBC_01220]
MTPVSRSPFGPGAERRCNITEHAKLLPMLQAGQQHLEASAEYLEKSLKSNEKLIRQVEAERAACRAAVALNKTYELVIGEHEDLKKRLDTMLPTLVQEVANLPLQPEAAEFESQLHESEAERGRLVERLRAMERERDAALRARDTAIARLQPREEGLTVGDAEALRERLDASSLCGVLEQAKGYCTMLVITADPGNAERLEHNQKAPQWRTRLTAALATLQAYAENKNLSRAYGRAAGPEFANLRAYCASLPSPLLSPSRVVPGEGQYASSSPRAKADRKLKVPEEIDPSGYAVMVEHIRIGDGSPPAPRLYYLDDTDRSGRIVVGFVGEHLRNASTN